MIRTHSVRLMAAALLLCLGVPAQQPSYLTAREPNTDWALSSVAGNVMFDLPGIANDYILSGGGQFVELPDGTARLTGRILSVRGIYAAFLVDLRFSGRVDPGQPNHPPGNSPVLELLPHAYAPSGPVDPGLFRYYTQGSGFLRGVRDLEGSLVALQLTGGALQVGLGANNRNATLGAQATFTVQVLQQPTWPWGPTSTGTLRADLVADRQLATTHVMVNGNHSPLPSDRGLVLPGVATDYFFVPHGGFTEFTDGHAELQGTLARISQLDDRWQVQLNLNGRLDPGQPGHPPTGSPVLGLLPSSYLAQGGPIDPSLFHYYTQVSGTLTGAGPNAGGAIQLSGITPFQVGGGANQANHYVGFHCTLQAQVLTQPTARTLVITGPAQLHGLTGTFPVLPFPSETPGPALTLSTLTDQGIVITGDNLAWVDLIVFDNAWLRSSLPLEWHRGWFRVIDNQHLEIHPPPGLAPGSYQAQINNPAFWIRSSPIQLVAPTSPTLVAEHEVRLPGTQHVRVHHGGMPGPALCAVGLSSDLLPSATPGVVSLAIGNQFQSLQVVPGSFAHDPLTGIASLDLGPIPAVFAGTTLHFQAVVLDLGNLVLPLPATTTRSTTYRL